MILKKKIIVDFLYYDGIEVIIGETLREAIVQADPTCEDDDSTCEAITLIFEDRVAACFSKDVDINSIVHECVHICSFIHKYHDLYFDLVNGDETFAYLTAYFVDQVLKVKHKFLTKLKGSK